MHEPHHATATTTPVPTMMGEATRLAARPLEAAGEMPAALGRAYEVSLGRSARKQAGVYYTPAVVVKHVVEGSAGCRAA